MAEALFKVVVNDELQHAIWPAHRDNAPGWRDAGFTGDEQQCAAHIAQVWPDIQPASLRSAP